MSIGEAKMNDQFVNPVAYMHWMRYYMLRLEIKGLMRSSGNKSAYSVIKKVYGFRGSRGKVLAEFKSWLQDKGILHGGDE